MRSLNIGSPWAELMDAARRWPLKRQVSIRVSTCCINNLLNKFKESIVVGPIQVPGDDPPSAAHTWWKSCRSAQYQQ